MPKGKPWTTGEIKKLREMIAWGRTKYEIGEALGRSPWGAEMQASNQRKTDPTFPRRQRRWSAEAKARIEEMADAGRSVKEIAEAFDVAPIMMKQVIYRLGYRSREGLLWRKGEALPEGGRALETRTCAGRLGDEDSPQGSAAPYPALRMEAGNL